MTRCGSVCFSHSPGEASVIRASDCHAELLEFDPVTAVFFPVRRDMALIKETVSYLHHSSNAKGCEFKYL